MMDAPAQEPCATHPDRPAAASCDRCGRPLCEECAIKAVAAEKTFCSERCRVAANDDHDSSTTVANETLRDGLESPIRTGWQLWYRSLGPIAAAAAPLAIPVAASWKWLASLTNNETSGTEDPSLLASTAVFLLVVAYSVAVIGLVLSRRYTGLVRSSVHPKALSRFLPWLGTWALMVAVTMAGYLALIVPGVYVSLRLFWADEYALVHEKGPLSALRASWSLTRESAGDIFGFQLVLGFASYLVLLPAMLFAGALFSSLDLMGWVDSPVLSFLASCLVAFVLLIAYGAIHAPELVKFYGMRADRAWREGSYEST